MINGANMLDRDELIEHLRKTLTVSWTVYARGCDEDRHAARELAWQEAQGSRISDQLWWLMFLQERDRLLFAYGMKLAEGPVLRWTAGESIFYSWPVEQQ